MHNIDNRRETKNVKNIIYVDCFSGSAGNMLLGALFDMGLPFEEWKKEVLKLNLENVEFSLKEKSESSIKGTAFDVIVNEDHGHVDHGHEDHGHEDHGHHHHHRTLEDINKIISSSTLSEQVKKESRMIFDKIAEAEGKIHNMPKNKVHFHEVGAVDSIIDIVGFCIAKEMMLIDEVYSSPFQLGVGTVVTAHGIMPVPAPATLEIIKGKPATSKGINGELTTPTGAGILATLSKDFGNMPDMTIHAVGYGYGTSKFTIPNFLRILYGNRRHL